MRRSKRLCTRTHIDHFGGVLGVTSIDAVNNGEVAIYAPVGFMEEAISGECLRR